MKSHTQKLIKLNFDSSAVIICSAETASLDSKQFKFTKAKPFKNRFAKNKAML